MPVLPTFSAESFYGPFAGLVLALTICGILFAVLRGLMKDLKAATEDVKETCKTMCDAFRAEAQEWRAEAKECTANYQNLVADILELKRRVEK